MSQIKKNKTEEITLPLINGVGENYDDLILNYFILLISYLSTDRLYLNIYELSFLLGFFEFFKSDLYSLFDILSSLSSIESWSLEFLLISIGVSFSSFLCEFWGFSNFGMDLFKEFFN